jgi:hypothetical protein
MTTKDEARAALAATVAAAQTALTTFDAFVATTPPVDPPPPPAAPVVTVVAHGGVNVVTATAIATAAVGATVVGVVFKLDGAQVGTGLNLSLSGVAAGSHTLVAVATDSLGATGSSPAATVVVTDPVVTPPAGGGGTPGTPNAFPDGTSETVQGAAFTYHGPKWIWINDTSSNFSHFTKAGYSTIKMQLLGGGTGVDIGANMRTMVAILNTLVTKYKLDSRGIFVGHSSGASILEKAIRHQYDPVAAGQLVDRFYGLGLSGVSWRTTDTRIYKPGIPSGPIPWPANITHIWHFTGVQHDPVNRHAIGGADESPDGVTQTMSMTMLEFVHHTATMLGFGPVALPASATDPARVVPLTITSPVVRDYAGNGKHVRCVVTPGEGHVLVSTQIDSPADFWSTMLT